MRLIRLLFCCHVPITRICFRPNFGRRETSLSLLSYSICA